MLHFQRILYCMPVFFRFSFLLIHDFHTGIFEMQWGLAGGEGVTGLKSYTSKDGIRLPSGRAGAYQVDFQAHELTILPSEF